MNKKVVKKWIKALRNGKYEQGKGYLKKDDKYCCLGVLCDLYIKEKKGFDWKVEVLENINYDGEEFSYCTIGGLESVPPEEVVTWVDLNREDLNFTVLIGLNDQDNYSFSQIADVIEKNYLKEDVN